MMDCDDARALLSARLDDESSALEVELGTRHLAECPACRSWWVTVGRVHRLLRVRPADDVPDLAAVVLERIGRQGPQRLVRVVLAGFAVVELLLALSSFVLGYGAGSAHDARHLGVFTAAIAVGLVYAAWRPSLSSGVLPVLATLVVAMTISALGELAHGRTTLVAEAHHALELSALACLWTLAGRPLPRVVRAALASRLHAAVREP